MHGCKQTDRHAHPHAQCSPGLTQARPKEGNVWYTQLDVSCRILISLMLRPNPLTLLLV